jgi:hypothetical protein
MNVIDNQLIAGKARGLYPATIVLALGLIVSAPQQGAAAISLVQTANGYTTSGKSVTATFPASPTEYNLLVAIVGVDDLLTINTPSGWSTAINQAGSPGQAIFYKIAAASEPAQVTFTDIVSSPTALGLHIYEYSGVNTLDQVSSDSGTGTSVSSGSVTTTSGNEAIVAGLVLGVESSYDDASWTNSFSEQNDFYKKTTFGGADRILSATGTYSTTATAGKSGAWRGQIASFMLELAISVSNPTFSFGTQLLDSWLNPQSTFITNDGTVAEDFVGSISEFTDGTNVWTISSSANGDNTIRGQWSITSASGPWSDVSAYDTDFTIATNVAAHDSVTFWFRIQTPTGTSSYNEHSSTLTVTAQEY